MKNLIIKFNERKALKNLKHYKYDKALKYLLKIQSIHETRKGLHYTIGLANMGLNKFEEAAQNFKKEMKFNGENSVCLALLGDIAYMDGKRNEANSYYKKSEKYVSAKEKNLIKIRIINTSSEEAYKNSIDSQALFEKAIEFEKRSNYLEAKKYYREAIELDKNHFMAIYNLAIIFMNKERNYSKAVVLFKKAYKINPMDTIRQNLKKAEFLFNEKNKLASI